MPTRHSGSPQEVLALNTYIKLTRAVESFESRLLQRATLEDLTISQFGVLEVLYHLGPLCLNEIGGKLLKSSGNMTMVIDNLEKRGLVKRVRSLEDRRMIRIHLTSSGHETIERVFPLHAAAITAELAVLSPEEQTQLGELCRKLGLGIRIPA